MWTRHSFSRNVHPSSSLAYHRAWCTTRPSARIAATPSGSFFLLTRELTDDLRVDAMLLNSRQPPPSQQHGAGGSRSTSFDGVSAALFLPFQGLSLGYASRLPSRSLAASHALLFQSLSESPDVLRTLAMRDPCAGRAALARLRCVQTSFSLVSHFREDVHRVVALTLQHRHLLSEVRLVHLIAANSPNASLLVAAELDAHRGCYATDMLWTLLSLPCAPDVLRVLLVFVMQSLPCGVTAREFQAGAYALLNNDNFFCERTFAPMHRLLQEVVVPALQESVARTRQPQHSSSSSFDFLTIRWTHLMNKWARVYTKSTQGFRLYDCLRALLRAAPAVETKLPPSFYVRVLGAVLDASVCVESADQDGNHHDRHSRLALQQQRERGWDTIKEVAQDALRLFGRNQADLRAIWVLLLKSALTLPPLREEYRRLLEAYHLCAQSGHAAPLDRQGFLQTTRLVSAALRTLPTAAVPDVVRDYGVFLHEQESATFLWLLDSVGALLTDLWESHGDAARGAAQELLDVLVKLLRDRRVTGVDIYANPVIARVLGHFHLSGLLPFWWTCGCGEELPCTAKRCSACLRHGNMSWTCLQCHTKHKTPCRRQSCTCGSRNPRLTAAAAAGRAICRQCGEVKDEQDVCTRCVKQQKDADRMLECAHCQTRYGANALHCPQCYAANPEKQPPLYLWHCAACDDFNYSIWSACRACKTPRKTGALFLSFVPWKCGCSALNHPGRLTCRRCGTGAHHCTYTCAGCAAHVSARSLRRAVITIDEKSVPLHMCPHCQATHPREDLLLCSPCFPRHCMLCAATIHPSSIAASGAFYHCGVVQQVNENAVFRCAHCKDGAHAQELQSGYHCAHCLFPRPEVEALIADNTDGQHEHNPNQFSSSSVSSLATSVWRCLHENEETEVLCGQWNYGWCSHCVTCGSGRPQSPYECRAKAQRWTCGTCGHANRPVDVLFCPHCKNGLQPAHPCGTCGMPHLSYACRLYLSPLP